MQRISAAILTVFLIINIDFVNAQSFDYVNNWDFEIREDVEKRYINTLHLESSELLESHDLYEIGSLEIDGEGNLMLFDYTNSYKIVYIEKGDFDSISYIGNGQGNGPLEFGKPFDLKFDANGNIWLADVQKLMIQQWSSEGDLLKSIKTPKYVRPSKIAILDSLKYIAIVSEQYTPNGVLLVFDFEGNLKSSFQKPINHEMRSVLYFESEIVGTGDELIVAGAVKPFMRKYNVNGNLFYSLGIINFEDPSQIISKKGRITSRNDDLVRATVDMQYEDSLIYIGISGKKKDRWMRELDIYNPKNGEYISSLKLKYPANYFAMLKDILYVSEFKWEDEKVYLSKYRISYD